MKPILLSTTETATLPQEIEQSIEGLKELPANASEADHYLRNLLELLEQFAVTYGGKLIAALLLLAIGFKLVNKLTKKIHKIKAFEKMEISTRNFMHSLINISLKVIIGITALAIMGVPMSSIVAVVGSCGLAIGLALQGSLSNIAGGFIILIFKPFVLGDFISAGDISGKVEDIGIFHTKLITVDNKRIIVPNATISNATLTNASALETRRVDLNFTASYDADISKVEAALLKVCNEHPLVLKDPAPFARLSAHLDSSLQYTVRVWCKNEDYWTVYYDLLKDVKVEFDAQGIEIPYPHLDVSTQA